VYFIFLQRARANNAQEDKGKSRRKKLKKARQDARRREDSEEGREKRRGGYGELISQTETRQEIERRNRQEKTKKKGR
jgi:hypothetical protein